MKDLLTNQRPDGSLPSDQVWQEKADQLRIYSGAQFQAVDRAEAGTVCAVTGLSRTFPGQGLGFEGASPLPMLEPVLTYQVQLPEGANVKTAQPTGGGGPSDPRSLGRAQPGNSLAAHGPGPAGGTEAADF